MDCMVAQTGLEHFGNRLRQLRKARGLTLSALATQSGITKGYLSKIERSPTPPPCSTLQAIASSLGVEVGSFFGTQNEKPASSNLEIHVPDGDSWQRSENIGSYSFLPLLQSYKSKYLSPFLMRIKPGATAYFKHDGEEFLYVLDGRVELEYEGRRHALKQGSAIYLDSRIRHRFHNGTQKTARVLAVNFAYRRF